VGISAASLFMTVYQQQFVIVLGGIVDDQFW
jgi:hypothetical protein